jgi:hypothetical protein
MKISARPSYCGFVFCCPVLLMFLQAEFAKLASKQAADSAAAAAAAPPAAAGREAAREQQQQQASKSKRQQQAEQVSQGVGDTGVPGGGGEYVLGGG